MKAATAQRADSRPQRQQAFTRSSKLRPVTGRVRGSSPISYHLVWIASVLLLVVGMCMVLSVSVAETVTGGDKFAYVRPQGIVAVVGLVLMVILSRLDYRRLRVASVFLLAVVFVSLVLVHMPGVGRSVGGASSYIALGPLTFQPSEFAKLAVVLAGAHLLSLPRVRPGAFASYMWPFGAIGLGMGALVALEGDLGTAIIIAGLLMGMLWLAGMKGKQWLGIAGLGVAAASAAVFSSSERASRVLSFFDPSADPQGSSYQLGQSLMALGRGGWFGVGPGGSVQKFAYLPEAHTDMIYGIIGEEFGLIGAGLVIVLFAVLAVACWRLARHCADAMGKYLIAGCGMLVTYQAIINIGGATGAMPLTGVPLPFISYGRNSLLVMLMAIGLILAVARHAPTRPMATATTRYENVTRIDRRGWDGRSRGARSGAG